MAQLRISLALWLLCIGAALWTSSAGPTNKDLTVSGVVQGPSREKRWGCPHPGCMGQKGDKGLIGPRGPRGNTGFRGRPGYCDAQLCFNYVKMWLPDQASDPPQQGDPGQDGPPGAPGPKGEAGERGFNGTNGEPGVPGQDGMPGSPGVQGDQGDPGRKGMPGPEGEKGMMGDPGLPGEQGMKGMPGTAGEKGLAGVPGMTGVPGKMGLPGSPGSDGTIGTNGVPGMKGEIGPPGPPIEVVPHSHGPCNESLQGVIRFDPETKLLYYCNSTDWVCIRPMSCAGSPTCPSPFGPQDIGDQWYQIFTTNITRETQDAADIVLLIDISGSMNREHEWLLSMVARLERSLIAAGIGDGAVPNRNRYCPVTFGGLEGLDLERGRFLPVNGEPCFPASDFPAAQERLPNVGQNEDAYEAMRFAIDNVPFRNSPFIAKNMILITDEGRTPIPGAEDLTRQSVEALLRENNILLNVVVWADYEVPALSDKVVIGVDSNGTSYLLEPEGAFSLSNEPVFITQAEDDTADVYVDLAIALGGATWALRILRGASISDDADLAESFTSALTQLKIREIMATIQSCRRCTCLQGAGESTEVVCVIAENSGFCRCVVENNGDQTTCSSGSGDMPLMPDGPIGIQPGVGGPGVPIPRTVDFIQLNTDFSQD